MSGFLYIKFLNFSYIKTWQVFLQVSDIDKWNVNVYTRDRKETGSVCGSSRG